MLHLVHLIKSIDAYDTTHPSLFDGEVWERDCTILIENSRQKFPELVLTYRLQLFHEVVKLM